MNERLPNYPYSHHIEGYAPLHLGDAVRVPAYGHKNWGIDTPDEKVVADRYALEWAGGNADQFALVRAASHEAGLYATRDGKDVDYPTLLQDETAKIVKYFAFANPKYSLTSYTILDVGCGPGGSSVSILNNLPYETSKRARFVLLDPSEESLVQAESNLIAAGAREDQIEVLHGTDLDLADFPTESVDFLTGVASIHHHANIPFDLYYRVLSKGGFAIFADWHHSLWEHPYRAYEFLRAFPESPETENMLQKWLEWYPEARTPIPEPENPADRQANEDITKFWLAYEKLLRHRGDFGNNAIWPLEGHRPVEHYVSGMKEAGFNLSDVQVSLVLRKALPSNPYQILPNSSLLNVTVGLKPEV